MKYRTRKIEIQEKRKYDENTVLFYFCGEWHKMDEAYFNWLFEPVQEKVTDCNQSAQPTTNSSQLPKLTAEVFDLPDCPEWAKYAAVDEDGMVALFEHRPTITPIGKWWDRRDKYCPLDGRYDYSDWQNSLIERPSKLPDWVMLGAYFWRDGYGYWRIAADSYKTIHIVPLFTDDDDNAISARPKSGLDFNKEDFAKLIQSGDIEQARLRRWTAKEAIGKVITDRGMSYWQITSADDAYVLVGDCKMQYSTMMNRFTQPNGNPCGCFEHFK